MKIGYLNYAFRETHPLTVAGATIEAGTLANLRKSQLDQKVRLRATGSGIVPIHLQDLPPTSTGRTVQVVALLDLQVDTVGAVTALSWYADVQGEAGGFSGAPITVPDMPDGFPRHLLFLLDTPITDCQLVRIYLDATGVGPIEVTLTASALWVGPLFALQAQGTALSTGDVLEIVGAGTNQRTPGGQDYGEAGVCCRVHSGSSLWLDQAAVFGDGGAGMDLQAMMMVVGTTQPILWLPDPSTPHMLHRTAIYGQFTALGRINRQQGKWRWDGWAVRESR